MEKIILASTSPRRKQLLKQIGLKFKVVSSDYEEDMNIKMKPKKLAMHLSLGKAENVAKKYKNDIIIAADTFIILEDKLLGKPYTKKQAIKTLKMISGKILKVITGFTVIDSKNGKKMSRAVETKIYIKKMTNKEINEYVATGEPLDKAGAFGIQERGAVFIKKIEGDYSNVVGLPLYELTRVLKKMKIKNRFYI